MSTPIARTRTAVALLAAIVLAACGSSGPSGQTEVEDVRARMSPRMAGVAGAYLDLTNHTDVDDRLVAARVDPEVAGRVEIHETYEMTDVDMPGEGPGPAAGHGAMDGAGPPVEDRPMDGDPPMAGHGSMAGDGPAPMMGMREIPHVNLPVGERVRLEPGGLHLMLMDLTVDLSPGDTFELTLVFEHAEPRTVEVEVREQA